MLRQLVTLSNNTDLPEISAWKVKSFWLQLLLVATIVLNYLGIDLTKALAEMGLGNSPEEVVATGQRAVNAFQEVFIPIILGVWMWLERRAPKFRLRLLPKVRDVFDWVPMIALVLLGMALTASSALAEGAQCFNAAEVREVLTERYDEAPIGRGIDGHGTLLEIWVNAETGTWTVVGTVVGTDGMRSCLWGSGQDWEAVKDVAPKGEPT